MIQRAEIYPQQTTGHHELTLKPRSTQRYPTLHQFLTGHGVRIPTSFYRSLAAQFGEEGKIRFRQRFIVEDPTALEAIIDRIGTFIEEKRSPHFPERTPEEIAQYRAKILQEIPAGKRKGKLITLEQACILVYGKSLHQLQQNKTPFEEAIRLAHVAVERSLPYLDGRAGEFRSINHFMRKGLSRITRNLSIDEYRSKEKPKVENKQKKSSDERIVFSRLHMQLGIPPEENIEKTIEEKMIQLANPIDRTIIHYRVFLGYSWNQIATLLYNDPTQAGKLKTHFSRTLDKLFPNRKK